MIKKVVSVIEVGVDTRRPSPWWPRQKRKQGKGFHRILKEAMEAQRKEKQDG